MVVNFVESYTDAPWWAKIGVETKGRKIVSAKKAKCLIFTEHLVIGATIPLLFGPVND